MALEATELTRSFRYNSVVLPDPGAQYSAEDVRELYAATYPEIVSAAIEGPEEKDGRLVYTFRRAVGTKGAEDLRPTLEAIAEGRTLAQLFAANVLEARLVKAHQPDFAAWRRFALTEAGEPLVAPADLIAPLA